MDLAFLSIILKGVVQ